MNENSNIDVRSLIDGIKANYDKRREGIAKGRKDFWLSLGDVFVGGIQIQTDITAMSELKAEVEKVENVKEGHTRWLDSPDRTAFEFLLVAAIGYEATLSKRHYYNCACKNALASEKSPTTAEEFAEWVEEKGGVMAAAQGADSRTKATDPADTISDYVKKLAPPSKVEGEGETDDPDIIPVDFKPDEAAGDLGLFLVQHLPGGQSRIIEKFTAPKVIASVIKLTDKTPSVAKTDTMKRAAVFDLSRFMLMKASEKIKNGKLYRGILTTADYERFQQAVEELAANPETRKRYFDGDPELEIDIEKSEINMVNKDAHDLDPARFIKNAKPLTLVGYKLTTETPVKKNALEAIPDFATWKKSRPRKSKA